MDLLLKLNLIVSPVPKATRPHQHGALSCVFLNGMNMAKLCLIDQWVVERQCVLSFMIYWAHCRQRSSTAAVFFLSDQLNETCSRIRLNLKLLCWCVKCSGCYRPTGWVEAGDGDVLISPWNMFYAWRNIWAVTIHSSSQLMVEHLQLKRASIRLWQNSSIIMPRRIKCIHQLSDLRYLPASDKGMLRNRRMPLGVFILDMAAVMCSLFFPWVSCRCIRCSVSCNVINGRNE